jgi:ectoine hydroxylase-related dioxygenase (phytanoyl-CoA dioxygenase family)
MDTSFTNSKESLAEARRDPTDWAGLTRAEQIRSIELEGFVVVPDLLSADRIAALSDEFSKLPTTGTDYSPHQRGHADVQWSDSPTAIDVIANPPVIEFLKDLFGDEVICTSCGYGLSEPGHPGIVVHTDSQPYGSKIFGLGASSPVLARVLYYLDDLTPDCSPFKVIPRSHLSMHRDSNPYNRMLSHPDELMVTCKAGSAVIINQKVFHGNFPNHSNRNRRMLAIAYRPAWAGPVEDVQEDRDPQKVAGLPAHIQPFFRSLNTRSIDYDVPNRPDNMPREAPGISPKRWGS